MTDRGFQLMKEEGQDIEGKKVKGRSKVGGRFNQGKRVIRWKTLMTLKTHCRRKKGWMTYFIWHYNVALHGKVA